MPLIIPIKLAILAHIKSTAASQSPRRIAQSHNKIFLHLNIPEQRDGRDTCKQGWRATLRRSVKWRWKATKLSLIWTVITILGPEVYTGLAIDDIIDAKRTLRHLSDLPPDKIPISGWTLAHAHYINMGGFSLRTAMGPDTEDFSDEESPPETSLIALTGDEVVELLRVEDSSSPPFPLPSKEEILDRSKTDTLAKLIIAFQILYFCSNCLTRAIRNLPLTLFELGTLGFAACSLITYGLLINKPRSVNTTIIVPHLDPKLHPQIAEITRKHPNRRRICVEEYNEHGEGEIWGIEASVIVGTLMAIILGGIHLVAWDFAFPTVVDKWVWRASSIASIIFALALVVGAHYAEENEDAKGRERFSVMHHVTWAAAMLYSVSRVVLIVEMTRCLFYLPRGAFTTTWAANIPHFA